jgi:hypothetical protein
MKNVVVFSLMVLASCGNHLKEAELYGKYVPVSYKNNFDTIQLKPQGVYHRRVFDRSNKLLLEMDGRWRLNKNSQLTFESFYQNLDDDLIRYPDSVKDTLLQLITDVDISNTDVRFCIGFYDNGQNCYKKLPKIEGF